MRVLLLSTYELGRQPLAVASPAARLLAAGHEVRALDLAVEPFDEHQVAWAEAVALSVPMHTAMRLAVSVAGRIRRLHPQTPIALYGLYAAVGADRTVGGDQTVGGVADRVIVGEYEGELERWVDELAGRRPPSEGSVRIDLGRSTFAVPARHLLPPLDRYARLLVGDERKLVGTVEASHGCRHRCRHCPIPAVYDGRYRLVGEQVVLADVDRLVALGARHITFADPDFLNGPAAAVRTIEAVHAAHPELTFDLTVKVEHILRHAGLWPRLAELGSVFVVSAFESVSDRVLALLDKGHTAADLGAALEVVRSAGIELRPSWLPFTPWTEPADVVELFGFLDEHRLLPATDPVQLGIRLLVPDGSLLLDLPEMQPHLRGYDPELLGWTWQHPDPRIDALQAQLAAAAAAGADRGEDPVDTLVGMWRLALEAAGLDPARARRPNGRSAGPRLSEAWFCCAEPTGGQWRALDVSLPG